MANTIRAKFQVRSIASFPNGDREVKMHAVHSDSEENKSFSKFTPSGEINLYVSNSDAVFEHGEYYIDITKVEPVPAV